MPEIELVEDAALWTPNPGGQQAFMDDYASRYLALAGGWYAGKTWAGARKLLDLHLHNAHTAAGELTGVDSCVIAQTYQLAETINIPELKKAMDECGVEYRFVSDQKKFWFDLPDFGTRADPSLIYVRTADSPDKITGFTVGAIWGDEVARWKSDDLDPTKDPLLQAKGRLRDPRARVRQFVMTFTHEGDCTKVYQDFEEDPKPDHRLYRAGTFENPHAQDFGESLKSQLTPDLASQYLDGQAAQLRGNRVYTSYADDRNKDDSLTLDDNLPLQVSVDFNIDPGMYAIVGQHFPHIRLLTSVYEIHRPRMDVRAMVAGLVELVKSLGGWRWPELVLFGDPAGNSKWAASGDKSAWDILIESVHQAGFTYNGEPVPVVKRVRSDHPAVGDRVNAFNCALWSIDAQVRYRVHGGRKINDRDFLKPGCPGLIRDFKSMKWDGGQLDKKDQKLSHPSDADGYRVERLMPIRRQRPEPAQFAVLQ